MSGPGHFKDSNKVLFTSTPLRFSTVSGGCQEQKLKGGLRIAMCSPQVTRFLEMLDDCLALGQCLRWLTYGRTPKFSYALKFPGACAGFFTGGYMMSKLTRKIKQKRLHCWSMQSLVVPLGLRLWKPIHVMIGGSGGSSLHNVSTAVWTWGFDSTPPPPTRAWFRNFDKSMKYKGVKFLKIPKLPNLTVEKFIGVYSIHDYMAVRESPTDQGCRQWFRLGQRFILSDQFSLIKS